MMDPATAVGFAASILTFVDFSWTLIRGSGEIYHSITGTTTDNARIGTVIQDLGWITKSIHSDIKGSSPHLRDLKNLAAECIEVSGELSTILEELKRKEGNKVWRSVESKWKNMRKEKEIASIEQKLVTYRLQLVLRLNLMLSEQQTSVKSQLDEIQGTGLQLSNESLTKLTTVHQAIHDLEKKLAGELFQSLRASENDNSNSLVEIHRSLVSVMTQLSAMPKLNTTENEILRRLYFNSFHSRNETISDAEWGTFEWLLENEHIEGISVSDPRPEAMSQSSQSESPLGIGQQRSDISAPIGEDRGSRIVESEVEPDVHESVVTKAKMKDEKAVEDPGEEALSDDESGGSCYLSAEENDEVEEGDSDGEAPSEHSPNNSNHKQVTYLDELKIQQRVRHSFLTWLKSGNQIYHISGKAGSGKSTLMKFIAQHPRLMIELIRDAFPRFWADAESGAPEWKERKLVLSELKSAMNVIVEKDRFPNHRFCFFIDGLDEFEGDSTDHWELAQMLQKWALSTDIKICVSSRPHTEFLDGFDSNLRMNLHELTRGDIHRFTYAMLGNQLGSNGKDETLSEIATEIVQMADGVFLWVRLVVRSLLDGVRHRSSLAVLKQKLHQMPRGLDSLFDKLFNNIDPSDRELSDKMLVLAASRGPLNALIYSWLEDLKDPDFPFKAPIQPYSDNEIRDRHAMVRCQLDGLSKGLLEMKILRCSGWNSERFPLASKDIYFKYNVEFFHRTVRDYLIEPIRYASIKQRLGDFDVIEGYQRLRLAEFKFARTMNDYFTSQGTAQTALVSCFSCLFNYSRETELPLKILNECSKVLEHHRQRPFSCPNEALDNLGVVCWGQAWDSEDNGSVLFGNSISFIHWTACFLTGISTPPNPLAHVTPRRLCSGGSGLAQLRLKSTQVYLGLLRSTHLSH